MRVSAYRSDFGSVPNPDDVEYGDKRYFVSETFMILFSAVAERGGGRKSSGSAMFSPLFVVLINHALQHLKLSDNDLRPIAHFYNKRVNPLISEFLASF